MFPVTNHAQNFDIYAKILARRGGSFTFGSLRSDFFRMKEYNFLATTSYTNKLNPRHVMQKRARPFKIKPKNKLINFTRSLFRY